MRFGLAALLSLGFALPAAAAGPCDGAEDAPALTACLRRQLDRASDPEVPEIAADRADLWQQATTELMDSGEYGLEIRATLLEWQALAALATGDRSTAIARLQRSLDVDDGIVRVTWTDADGEVRWRRPVALTSERADRVAQRLAALEAAVPAEVADALERLAAGRGTAGATIVVEDWHEFLPDTPLKTLDGRSAALTDGDEAVTIVDFWASWCAPCRQELPRLQRLAEVLSAEGVRTVTVNLDEDPAAGREFAEEIDLSLPVLLDNGRVSQLMRVDALPALFITDTRGHVRHRWDGYTPGLEITVGEKVRELLADPPTVGRYEVGRVRSARLAIKPLWMREFLEAPVGLTAVPAREGLEPVAVALPRAMALVDPLGRVRSQSAVPPYNGRLRSGWHSDGRMLVGFREGGTRFIVVESSTATNRWVEVGTPIFDASIEEVADGASVVLATLDGLRRWRIGGDVEEIPGHGFATSLTHRSEGGWWLLEPGARLLQLDAEFREVASRPAPPESWATITDGRGAVVGYAEEGVRAAATGSWGPEGRQVVAIATEDDRLWLLDAADGSVLLNSDWPGLTSVVAEDLDDDGSVELVVLAEMRIVALQLAEPGAGRSPESASGANSGRRAGDE